MASCLRAAGSVQPARCAPAGVVAPGGAGGGVDLAAIRAIDEALAITPRPPGSVTAPEYAAARPGMRTGTAGERLRCGWQDGRLIRGKLPDGSGYWYAPAPARAPDRLSRR